jgi:hypothetical protein
MMLAVETTPDNVRKVREILLPYARAARMAHLAV